MCKSQLAGRSFPSRSLPALAPGLVAAAAALLLGPGALAAVCDGISPASETPLTTVRITTGLTKPLYVISPPADTHRIFVVEQDGYIRIVKDGTLLPDPFLDIDAITQSTGNEEGLLNLAFSPDYTNDGYFFVYHTENGGTPNTIARYKVSVDPDVADPNSRVVVLSIVHSANSNHNGGGMLFGPDGYLYLGVGDGGGSCDDPFGNAQNTGELKGKMLRIDVIPAPAPPPAKQYRIPLSNPYAGPGNPLDEILSIGLRNPWRFSFDRLTHDLYIGDVGQNAWEEIDYRPAASIGAENYGWDHYEGLICPPPPPSPCGGVCAPISPRVDPVKVYSLSGAPCAVTSGYVYRGCRMPGLASRARYFYADYCAASISSFVISEGVVTSEKSHTSELAPVGGFTINLITSWGEDAQGEIYMTDRGIAGTGSGEVFKIVPVLRNLEVSGSGASQFLIGTGWTWENLALTSSHPIDHYRVYRNDGNGAGIFTCVYRTPSATPPNRPATTWPGGDSATPLPGSVYSYLVTAVEIPPPSTQESSPGRRSDGTPRSLSPVSCPP